MRPIDADILCPDCLTKQGKLAISQSQIAEAPTVERKSFASFSFDKDELDRIVNERVIEPIKNGELVIKEKRPTGHWIIEECSLGKTYYCSECYAHPEVCFDFCPYCGADMRKEANNGN